MREGDYRRNRVQVLVLTWIIKINKHTLIQAYSKHDKSRIKNDRLKIKLELDEKHDIK